MSGYERAVRPVLFRLPAERAHRLATGALRLTPAALGRRRGVLSPPGAERVVCGIRFPNPVGLAAGMDKDGHALPAWPSLGFGFVEVGTVTRYAQRGNDRPRLFRLPASGAIVNRMGFNNAGAAALARRLSALDALPVPLGISLGKSKLTPIDEAVSDYLASLSELAAYGDYYAVNVSSPNTPGLRQLQDRAQLTELLGALRAATPKPLLVKVAPDLTERALAELLDVCLAQDVSGLIATNTTTARDGLAQRDVGAASAIGPGGLSGRPLTVRARDVVRFVARESGLPVIGVGGLMSPDDALRMLDAGASLVQLYTGFVYGGPSLIRKTVRAIAES